MLLQTIADFEKLKIKSRIYKICNDSHIRSYFFAGFSPINIEDNGIPVSGNSGPNPIFTKRVMLVHSDNVSNMSTLLVKSINRGKISENYWCDDYEESKIYMYREYFKRGQIIKDIYLQNWTESDYRDFNLDNILDKTSNNI